ncbi:helix-turn-helix domain-containing protein [Chitinophaga sp. Hz27]|uniref:helix-turn-helix domain-containing protein n=1 Tax=Chitinophaga sp. Hz27 TaxID=3347169 RepID=UPI0035DC655F
MGFEVEYDKEMEDLGLCIKELRKHKGWTQQQLAVKVSLSREHIGHIEGAKGDIKFETLVKLATVFEIEVSALFNGQGMGHLPTSNYLAIENRLITEKQLLGNRILQISKHRGLDIQELSILTKIDYSDTFKYLNGEKNMELRTIFKFATALEVGIKDLFNYNNSLPDNSIYVGKT